MLWVYSIGNTQHNVNNLFKKSWYWTTFTEKKSSWSIKVELERKSKQNKTKNTKEVSFNTNAVNINILPIIS